MFISDLFEAPSAKKIIVVYPGRFQPFHKGHKSVYDHLVKTFGNENVYIVTSGKIDPAKSPFSFTEKEEMMQLAGINKDRIVQSSQPYRAAELTQQVDADNTILIFAISEKDMAEDPRFSFANKKDGSPSYFQPLKNIDSCEPLSKHGYITTVPTVSFKVLGKPANSATQIRDLFKSSDEDTQKKIVVDLFGAYDENVFRTMQNKLQAAPVTEGLQKRKYNLQKIEEQFGHIRYNGKSSPRRENLGLYEHLAHMKNNKGWHDTFWDIIFSKAALDRKKPIKESIDQQDPVLTNIFSQFGSFASLGTQLSRGDKISLIEVSATTVGESKSIYIDGFIAPKTIIELANQVIYFADGTTYPESQLTKHLQKWHQVITFSNKNNAIKCQTMLGLFGKKLGEWTIHNEIENDQLGENAVAVMSANEAMVSAILRRIMQQHPDALKKYGVDRIMDAAHEEGEWWGDAEEIGSSDVSAAVNSALRSLASGGEA